MTSVYKICVAGEALCGKSSLIDALTYSDTPHSPENYQDVTRNISFNVDGKERALQIVDTGRVSSGGRMDTSEWEIPLKFVDCNAIMVCFDISNRYSLDYATKRWVRLAKATASTNKVPVYLVGCKSDLRTSYSISKEDGEQFANAFHADGYFECSANNHEGVANIFEYAVREIDAVASTNGGTKPVAVTTMRSRGSAIEELISKTNNLSPTSNVFMKKAPPRTSSCSIL